MVEDHVEEGIHVGAGHGRVQRCRAGAGIGVDDRELDLGLGCVQVQEQLVGLVDDLGEAGSDVLKTWERMDEGDLEFDEGLREAAQPEGKKETPEKEAGESAPAF